MCIAAPGQVTQINGNEAKVSYPGLNETRRVMVLDVSVKVGDLVLVQMGIVVQVLSDEESQSVKQAWEELS